MREVKKNILLILIIFSCFCYNTQAQQNNKASQRDSLLMLQPGMDTTQVTNNTDSIYIEASELNRPKIAAFYSAAFPGLGQIYNNTYWKLPILYGGFITLGYFINWNNNKYQQYRNALFDVIDGDGVIDDPLAEVASEDALRRGVEYYRRNRDFLMILTAGLYFLQIVEAHVDAHLLEFEISDDLSASLKPHIGIYHPASYSYGLNLVFTLN